MTCEEVERDEVVEQYVLGRLEKEQQEAFEDHYFNCTRCLERLRVLEETRGELAVQGAGARPQRWRRAAAALGAAAVLVLGIRVGQDIWSRRDVPPQPGREGTDVVLPLGVPPAQPLPGGLGEIELPSYTPPRLRATPTDAQRAFRDAMTAYTGANCGAAMPGLRRSLAMDESLTQARFYLAVCELQTGRLAEAAANFRQIVALGESPYLEDSHFFLAKAHIRQGDREAARRELTRVLTLQGDRREEAQQLLDRLR